MQYISVVKCGNNLDIDKKSGQSADDKTNKSSRKRKFAVAFWSSRSFSHERCGLGWLGGCRTFEKQFFPQWELFSWTQLDEWKTCVMSFSSLIRPPQLAVVFVEKEFALLSCRQSIVVAFGCCGLKKFSHEPRSARKLLRRFRCNVRNFLRKHFSPFIYHFSWLEWDFQRATQ